MRATDGKHFPSEKFKQNFDEIFRKVEHIEECKKEKRELEKNKDD